MIKNKNLSIALVLVLVAGIAMSYFFRNNNFYSKNHIPEFVCASYVQIPPSPDYIQGVWTDDADAVSSREACDQWMTQHIGTKKFCATPEAVRMQVVLVSGARHIYDLPPDISEVEFVSQQECIQ